MRTYVIDRDGDLALRVGQRDERTQFFVDSRTLSCDSPVFKSMLYGPFLEARPADRKVPWVVYLPEDDPRSARMLFQLAHLQFENRLSLPPHIADLYGMLTLSDKYDMLSIFQPWASMWASSMVVDISSPINLVYLMAVQREFGSLDSLDRLARSMVRHCGMDDDGNLTTRDGAIELPDTPMPIVPPGLLENIVYARQNILRSVFTRFRKLIEGAEASSEGTKDGRWYVCYHGPRGNDACSLRVVKFILAGLGAEEEKCIRTNPGDPFPYQKSLGYLIETVRVLKRQANREHTPGHFYCVFSYIEELRKILDQAIEEVKSWHLVSEENEEYMLGQRKRLGEVEFDTSVVLTTAQGFGRISSNCPAY